MVAAFAVIENVVVALVATAVAAVVAVGVDGALPCFDDAAVLRYCVAAADLPVADDTTRPRMDCLVIRGAGPPHQRLETSRRTAIAHRNDMD